MAKKKQQSDKPDKLNAREERFVVEYLQCFNATQAAKAAGYSERSARELGHRNLHKPRVEQAIRDRLDKEGLTPERVKLKIAQIIFGLDIADYADLLSSKTPAANLAELKKQGVDTSLIESIQSGKDGVKISLPSKLKALEMAAKVLQLYSDTNINIGALHASIPAGATLEEAIRHQMEQLGDMSSSAVAGSK